MVPPGCPPRPLTPRAHGLLLPRGSRLGDMATVLLTGASGFLGVHTVQHLLDSGHRVRAFVRTPARLAASLRPLGLDASDSRIEVAQGDITDPASVSAAVDGCDSVVHAAATYSFKR